uniref:Uncharacterized protein n=1 Tax=Sphaerodactylus townsendi TaxID=933632 RepID=A0ACB8FBT6_9SAUR
MSMLELCCFLSSISTLPPAPNIALQVSKISCYVPMKQFAEHKYKTSTIWHELVLGTEHGWLSAEDLGMQNEPQVPGMQCCLSKQQGSLSNPFYYAIAMPGTSQVGTQPVGLRPVGVRPLLQIIFVGSQKTVCVSGGRHEALTKNLER